MSLNPVRPQRIGNFRDLIVWQERTSEATWVDRETEPARVEPLKGREQYEASISQRFSTADYRVFCRHRYVPDTANWRVLWLTGRLIADEESPPGLVPERLIMDIEAVMNPDERRRYIELTVTNTASASFPPVPDPEPEPEPEPEDSYTYTITAGQNSSWTGFMSGTIGSIDAQPIAGATITSTVVSRHVAGDGGLEISGSGLPTLLSGKDVFVNSVKVSGGSWHFESGSAIWWTDSFPALVNTNEYTVEIKADE